MFDAKVSVNTGFEITPGVPAYNPTGANAANFINEVFDHEFGTFSEKMTFQYPMILVPPRQTHAWKPPALQP
jgi:hypothetical protein